MALVTMRGKLEDAQDTILYEMTSKKEISTDMTRQYLTMQMQLENRIDVLEGMMRKLQELDPDQAEVD